MGFGDLGGQAAGELGDALLEGLDGLFEAADFGLGVGVKAIEELGEVGGIGEVGFVGFETVLIEDGAAGVLEDDIGGG